MKRVLFALCLLLPTTATAHPHVFIAASAGFYVDASARLTGLRIVWLYDAFSTLVLYDQLDLDRDGDGVLDAGDLSRIAEGETDWPPEYPGDTYLWQGGTPVALGRPQHGRARMVGDRVEVSFDLPLASPLVVTGTETSLKLFDPAYYYAYTLQTVLLPSPIPPGCRTGLRPFRPDEADERLQKQLAALSIEEIPDDPNIGARFADALRLTCD
ncbi:hypothetical protein BV509_20690 [Rhodovulum sulfidophilum]|uniref:DUF1007 family protein n=1 Tax=Rhodovulum visakhapatnamense TaxID=364297 RepID=A0ABS1RDU9_9RHOB|nr:DUF1007 family protein [Rhodovulum visakhapatnamense]MBL3569744.1 DUF1007 family protein [Rhodovulum visakhapatnamense]MBL3577826.1 DUF1007 family protein [Rhodovulum visakhapatnamense]OLS42342.1 hypothetical protein BV509_20690 [Rhodovulum sulfidophilum]